MNEYQHQPIDPKSVERLADQGLRMRLVDTASPEFPVWLQAVSRGFHGARQSEESIRDHVAGGAHRRTTGVWDETGADAASPVATVDSWPSELTVPGRRSLTAWAISGVTVAATHRRRGIARALLEAELRTAHALGVPMAMLTVSESTIYSRYGFAPAAMAADWSIDTLRAKWAGPTASGRVHFVTVEQGLAAGAELIERVRLDVPGEIEFSGYLWERMFGIYGDDKELGKQLRVVRYDDEAGLPQGLAIYRVAEVPGIAFTHTLELKYLVTATDDAYAGLWRYLLEMDLISVVTSSLRFPDEAVAWQVSDFRAAHKTKEQDHLWTRILDLRAALEGRSYGAPGRILLEVSDPLAFAAGRVMLTIDADGSATVTTFDAAIPDAVPALSLTVNELSAIHLGGVSAVTLAQAGRITELSPGAAVAADAAFRSAVTPRLSIWF